MASEERALEPAKPQMGFAAPGGRMLPEWWTEVYGPRVFYVTTLDAKKPADRALLLDCLQGETENAKEWINRDLPMIGFTMSPAVRVVDGEVQEWVRTVVHLADGTNVAFGSMGVVKSLMLIQQLDREPPWQPPLVKRLVARTLQSGGQWYSLIDPPTGKAGGKAK